MLDKFKLVHSDISSQKCTTNKNNKGIQSSYLRKDTTSSNVGVGIICVRHRPCQGANINFINKNEKIPSLSAQLFNKKKILSETVSKDQQVGVAFKAMLNLKKWFKTVVKARKDTPLVFDTTYGKMHAYFDSREKKVVAEYDAFADFLEVGHIDARTGEFAVARVPRVSMGQTRTMDFFVEATPGKADTADNYKVKEYRKHLHSVKQGILYLQGFYIGIRAATKYDLKQIKSFCHGNQVVVVFDGTNTARGTVMLNRRKLVGKVDTRYYSLQEDHDFVASGHIVISPNASLGKHAELGPKAVRAAIERLVRMSKGPKQKIFISVDGISKSDALALCSVTKEFPQVRLVTASLPNICFAGGKVPDSLFRFMTQHTDASKLDMGRNLYLAQQKEEQVKKFFEAAESAMPRQVLNSMLSQAMFQIKERERICLSVSKTLPQTASWAEDVPNFGPMQGWGTLEKRIARVEARKKEEDAMINWGIPEPTEEEKAPIVFSEEKLKELERFNRARAPMPDQKCLGLNEQQEKFNAYMRSIGAGDLISQEDPLTQRMRFANLLDKRSSELQASHEDEEEQVPEDEEEQLPEEQEPIVQPQTQTMKPLSPELQAQLQALLYGRA